MIGNKMNTFQDVYIKKRHNGYAEIRSYMLEVIKARGKGIRFVYIDDVTQEKDIMCVPFSQLNRGFVTAKGIKSKVNKGQTFDLVSFLWKERDDSIEESKTNGQLVMFE